MNCILSVKLQKNVIVDMFVRVVLMECTELKTKIS